MSDSLLELDRVTKRFGRVVIAEDLSLAVGSGDIVGIVGPNGAGKTSLFGLISGDLVPRRRRGPARRPRGDPAGRGRTLPARRRAHLPGAAAVRGHDRVREPARRRPAGRLACGGERATPRRPRRSTGPACPGRRTSPPSGSACCSASGSNWRRALATQPTLLLLDEVAGGLTDPEVAQLVEIVRAVNADGIAVIWIEHVVRALTAVVSRLMLPGRRRVRRRRRACRGARHPGRPRGIPRYRRDGRAGRKHCRSALARPAPRPSRRSEA